MTETAKIKSFSRVVPMIYAYNTPGIVYHDGWTKIGYTEKQTVEQRIRQQTHTAGIRWELAWQDNAMYKDGSGQYFTDRAFHDFLEVDQQVQRESGTEWFHLDGPQSLTLFNQFSRRATAAPTEGCTYDLRQEQREAVEMTQAYFEQGGTEFLWNAKPRFGKTLTAYDLISRMGFQKVLIVTNRPSVANSWAEDFQKFIGWRGKLCFVSDTDALKGSPGVMSRQEYLDAMHPLGHDSRKGMVAFESLQGLKGSVYFGGEYDKLAWMAKEYTDSYGKKQRGMEFDLLIVDEAQEGVETIRTDRAFRNIQRKHTLYLSGTPFKQLASEQFSTEQIFNWSYADEQDRKEKWDSDEYNPYEELPRLAMFTYQLSSMIYDQVKQGIDLTDDGTVDYAFDLNEFFATNESGKFVHEADIRKFLHSLTTNEKYPFSTPELRRELSHTLWLLNHVASAKALAKLLKDDEFRDIFGDYEIVLAAGDGRLDDGGGAIDKSYDRVKAAIRDHERTITLSVGQLTVGVTIPEWSGVLMLCNMQSASSYMQAAFRAQNPCIFAKDGQCYRKETAYVFDFDPARTLIVFDEFANNLNRETAAGRGTSDDRKENIKRLLNFFPVLGEDSEGRMVELDAAAVLSIPRKLKSQEVVRRGFMSNFLFQNISNIFNAPGAVKGIVEKMNPANEGPKKRDRSPLDDMANVNVDENGNLDIPGEIIIGKAQGLFGQKFYENATQDLQEETDALSSCTTPDQAKQAAHAMAEALKAKVKSDVIAPAVEDYGVKKSVQNRMERQTEQEIEDKFNRLQGNYEQQVNIAKVEHDRQVRQAESQSEKTAADEAFKAAMDAATQAFVEASQAAAQQVLQDKPAGVVKQMEEHKATEEKKFVEDTVRAHLRGFSRTIPSFIMAYGDGGLTLANFDTKTEADVFQEVTGITVDDFRFLRDGGDYTDPDTGKRSHFAGHLFDEVVFNDSVEEFWRKKQQLADYFGESQEEDIFDYIPPQKTNQIFTPKRVVSMMVDQIEENNPGCFDDPTKKFADLYMKSGLYITEIVKRLYRSEGLKAAYPDERERIRHILQEQVFGMAPTRIIYLIATNYILGFDEELKHSSHNFVEADAAEASKLGTLEALVEQHFGK